MSDELVRDLRLENARLWRQIQELRGAVAALRGEPEPAVAGDPFTAAQRQGAAGGPSTAAEAEDNPPPGETHREKAQSHQRRSMDAGAEFRLLAMAGKDARQPRQVQKSVCRQGNVADAARGATTWLRLPHVW